MKLNVFYLLFFFLALTLFTSSVEGTLCSGTMSCPPGQYCATEFGDCYGMGTCQPKPTICLALWDPVCGCDGVTYSNACYAAAAGVNVAYPGVCGSSVCYDNWDCYDPFSIHFCSKPAGDCDGVGTCAAIPEYCPTLWAPVCGCDGVTYPNDCVAAMAGMSVSFAGQCELACSDCIDCDPSTYCKKPVGDCYGVGQLTPRPTSCTNEWNPVCGCDGFTYRNACYAAMNGVSIAATGACAGNSCQQDCNCDVASYCSRAVGDCGGLGECQVKPTACTTEWAPVCGCDGVTYGNACEAAVAGVNVRYEGACPICVTPPLADLNGDCRVDLIDMAILSSQWLTCGLDRQELCWN
jgi:hypothetical protein